MNQKENSIGLTSFLDAGLQLELMLEKRKARKVKATLGIAYKEAEETEYWLQLCKHADDYPFEETMYNDIQSIIKVLGKIISSTH